MTRQARMTIDELIIAVAARDPQRVSRVLNPLRRDELEAVSIILADNAEPTVARITTMIRMAAIAFDCNSVDVTSTSRTRLHVDARTVAAYGLRLFDMSYPQIGRALNRDHTSAMNLVSRAGENPRLRNIATGIATDLGWRRPEEASA